MNRRFPLMRSIFPLIAINLLVACASPKYTADDGRPAARRTTTGCLAFIPSKSPGLN